MVLPRASFTTPMVDSNPRKCDRKDFPHINFATTRSAAASTHRTRRFSLAHPPSLTPPAHPERTATTLGPFCPSLPASPRGTHQPQSADSLYDGREERAGHRYFSTGRSCASGGTARRRCPRGESRGAVVATGSRSAGGRRWRRGGPAGPRWSGGRPWGPWAAGHGGVATDRRSGRSGKIYICSYLIIRAICKHPLRMSTNTLGNGFVEVIPDE